MIKRELVQVKPYVPTAGDHYNMVALKLHGAEESGINDFWMGLSHFLPSGGAGLDDSPFEKVYFCIEGELTILDVENSQKIVIAKNDSIAIGPGEKRKIVNETNDPASMLVVYSTSKKIGE